MPKWQPTRVQMDICPLACACFSIDANVVFIFVTGGKKHHFGKFVKKFLCGVNCLFQAGM